MNQGSTVSPGCFFWGLTLSFTPVIDAPCGYVSDRLDCLDGFPQISNIVTVTKGKSERFTFPEASTSCLSGSSSVIIELFAYP